uniref:Actin-related protein 2/3 complex subunit 3 n=1 Tax=Hordeum vulgare subsp. vulgare TaxID=112509 RepID=A0A287XS03_HORVV
MFYHSSFTDDGGITKACGYPLLPLKTHIKGPAPASDPDKADIIDEAITFFRANVFFKNFHVKSLAELLRNYLKQIREETSGRLLNCAYRANGTPNKWWLAFAKRKFMNLVIL